MPEIYENIAVTLNSADKNLNELLKKVAECKERKRRSDRSYP
jgi:hypothetical protein